MTPGGTQVAASCNRNDSHFWGDIRIRGDIGGPAGVEIARDFQQLAAAPPRHILAEGQIVGL
jgi:hypothetical protein